MTSCLRGLVEAFRWCRRRRRGSVAVELALVVSFLLVPLVIGSVDVMYVLIERYQINQALNEIYLFAWTDPADASNSTDIGNILVQSNTMSLAPIDLANQANNPGILSYCLQPDGSLAPPDSDGACSTGQTVTYVSYALTAAVHLPVGVPFLPQPFNMNVSGAVQLK